MLIHIISLLLTLSTTWAQEAAPTSDNKDAPPANAHLRRILVLGDYDKASSLLDVVPTVTKLEGMELTRKRTTSLGDTLKSEVGVNASGYGPTASRPIIRGLEGDRVRILQNGIGVLDASGASQDHAVPLDPISIDSIEIVRGPITLLYGSSAVGGVVNLTNSRIHDEYTEGFSGIVDAQTSSVNSGQGFALKADYGVNKWMFHVDGNISKTQDVKVPGYSRALSVRLSDPLNPEPRDKMPNSSSQISSFGAGTTYLDDWGYLGLSFSEYNSEYGVVVEPGVRIDMVQDSIALASEVKHVGPFKAMRIKSTQTIYKHQEIEEGVPGTTFKNNGNEARVEFVQHPNSTLTGLVGLQSNIFEFSALGEEAFLPTTATSSFALFAFEELNYEPIKINFGARGEFSRVKPEASGSFTITEAETFNTGSASAGALYKLTEQLSTSLNLSYNERAPNYQELFANGPHVATFAYQRGDTNLEKEKSVAAEMSLRHQTSLVTSVFNIYGQHFNNFIALTPSGAFDDTDGSGVAGDSNTDLPIFNYLAQAADIYGAELDFKIKLPVSVPGALGMELKGDYVRGKNSDSGDNLPRMSPPRASIGFNHKLVNLTTDMEVQQVFKQTDTALNETATDGYMLANFGVSYQLNLGKTQTTLYGRLNNAFDVEARNHVSFIKDYSQLGGRNFVFGVRGYF